MHFIPKEKQMGSTKVAGLSLPSINLSIALGSPPSMPCHITVLWQDGNQIQQEPMPCSSCWSLSLCHGLRGGRSSVVRYVLLGHWHAGQVPKRLTCQWQNGRLPYVRGSSSGLRWRQEQCFWLIRDEQLAGEVYLACQTRNSCDSFS